MKLTLAASLLPLLVQGNPVAVSEAGSPLQLAPRADKWCRVDTKDVACRKGAGTGYAVAGRVQPFDNFGVHCMAKGEMVGEGSLRTEYAYSLWQCKNDKC
jgi:hypothetical protein